MQRPTRRVLGLQNIGLPKDQMKALADAVLEAMARQYRNAEAHYENRLRVTHAEMVRL